MFVKREFPEKDPHKSALSDISWALSYFVVPISFILLLQQDFWLSVMQLWNPKLIEVSKYNLFSPAAFIMFLIWYLLKKGLNLYYSKQRTLESLELYFNQKTNQISKKTYDNHGRFLIAFFSLGGVGSVILYFWKGLLGLLPIFLFLFLYECWVRYEFQWKNRN